MLRLSITCGKFTHSTPSPTIVRTHTGGSMEGRSVAYSSLPPALHHPKRMPSCWFGVISSYTHDSWAPNIEVSLRPAGCYRPTLHGPSWTPLEKFTVLPGPLTGFGRCFVARREREGGRKGMERRRQGGRQPCLAPSSQRRADIFGCRIAWMMGGN